jgi:5-bromo-4-chloroindolyl phosphate hydrolysis protein
MISENSTKEKRMPLTKEQEELYKKTMEEAKAQFENIDAEMEQEIQKTREILAGLQASKKHFLQIYQATANLLGVEVELSKDDQGASLGDGGNEDKEEKKQA